MACLAGSSILAVLLLAGCQAPASGSASSSVSASVSNTPAGSTSTQAPVDPIYNEPIAGFVMAGKQSVSNASVQLYQAGTAGDGSAALPLLTTPAQTNAAGAFSISGAYSCNFSQQVYIVATGGNPGLAEGTNNAQATMMAGLGRCGSLGKFSNIVINELTTIASVYSLAPFMVSATSVGAGTQATDAQVLDNAFKAVSTFVDVVSGTAPGKGIPAGQIPPTQKLDTLGSILDSCIVTAGGTVGDGSACGNLFAASNAPQHAFPSDTLSATLQIALAPTNNVSSIFQLFTPPGPFKPALTSAPVDWTLEMTSTVPTPTFYPAPGAYSTPPTITLLDNDSAAAIHYTTDGSKVVASSAQYTVPFTLPNSATVNAVAIAGGLSSVYASGTYSLPISVALTPTTVGLSASQTQTFTATVVNTSDTAVSWSLNPAVGSLSATGVYTAPAIITVPQTVTVTAASVINPSATASATISLGIRSFSINASSLIFGSVVVGTPTTQSVTLTSTGTMPVTISSASLTGAGFTLLGAPFPITINPTLAASLIVQFDPAVAGPASGQLTINSNSSTGGTTVGLSGTGQPHEVDLSWDAPASSPDPVTGYNIYSSSDGGNTYQLVNSSVNTGTTYADTTVQGGLSYDYYVTSVDASGFESTPSNTISVTIP